jgi:hypothetical protein
MGLHGLLQGYLYFCFFYYVNFKPELCYCRYEFVLKLRVANMCFTLLHCDLPGLNEILPESDLARVGNEMRCAGLSLRADPSGSAAGNSHSSPALRIA